MQIPQAILFDLDGVLLDTEPLHGKAWRETARVLGAYLSDEQLILLQGRRRKDCAKKVLEWAEKQIDIKSVLEIHQPISKGLLKHAKPMPGAEELIKWCHSNNLPIALITSSSSNSIKIKTSPHPWLDLFLIKVQGDDPLLSKGKPSPDPYLLGAKKLSLEPEYCWAVEDSISGTKSALSAGCKVWVLKANSKELTAQNSVTKNNPVNIGHLNEILKILKSLYQ